MTANDNDQGALARLAAYCGIAAEYGDVWGKPHATSENTLRALLTAMHFPADADPASLLQTLQQDEWRRPLPPVQVVTVGEAASVPVSLPAARTSHPHRWILTRESGASSSGEFEPAELPRLGEQHLDGERIADCRPPAVARRLHQIRDTAVRVFDPVGGGEGWGNCQPIAAGPWPELGLDDDPWM